MAELISCFANPVALVAAQQADLGIAGPVRGCQKTNVPATAFGLYLFRRAASVGFGKARFCGFAPAPKHHNAGQGSCGSDISTPTAKMPRTCGCIHLFEVGYCWVTGAGLQDTPFCKC